MYLLKYEVLWALETPIVDPCVMICIVWNILGMY